MLLAASFALALLAAGDSPAMPWPGSAERSFEQFRLQGWSREQGLPSNELSALARTPDGFLWIASTEGLARFDGRHFRNYDSGNTPAFASNEVRALAVAADGSLYVMLAAGQLLRYAQGRFVQIARLDGMPAVRMFPHVDGSLLLCRHQELLRLDAAGELRSLAALPDHPDCAQAPDGSVHIVASGLWLRCAAAVDCERHALPPRSHPMGHGIHVANDRVWIWDFRILREYAPDGGLRGQSPTPAELRSCATMLVDAEQTLWCARDGVHGLARSPREPAQMRALVGAIGKSMDLLADSSGALWVATWGQGLRRLSAPPVLSYGTDAGLHAASIIFLHQREDGSLLLGNRAQLHLLSGGRAQLLPVPRRDLDGLLDVTTLANGDLLIARALGLERNAWPPHADGWRRIHGGERPDGHYRLERVADGSILFSGPGLQRHRLGADGSDHIEMLDPDLSTVYAFASDAGGRRYAATNAGIWRERADGRYEASDTPAPTDGRFILMSALRDRRGGLWFGGYEIGIYHLQDASWRRITPADGLPSATAYGIVEDDAGRLWISHGRGLYTLELDSVARWRSGHGALAIRRYTRADGLRGEAFNGGSGTPALRDRGGYLWFASDEGAVRIDPRRMPQAIPRPQVLVESLHADGVAVAPAPGGARIAPGVQALRLALALPAPGFAERVDAHWRLDREGWRALPDDGVLELQRLPAGSHRLQVQVAVDGVYSDALDLPLLQLPRWHERTVTWWIAALAALLGGGLLWRWRMHALLRRNEQLERTVQQRSEALVGERRRALEAEAAQRGAEQALHLRRLTAAQATYAELQPRERLLLAALAQAPADVATLAQCLAAQAHALGAWPPAEVAATLHRLAERGLVAAVGGGWRLADADLPLLPDLALPLPELAVRHARRVGAYRLLERIGVGGSGEVYRARSIDGAEEVALKLLHADPALRADAVRRLDREWDTVARLRHPNIVRMCERGEHDGRLYLAMELVRGCTLAQRLDAEGALPEEQARSILRQLLAALSALHGAGVAHRDLNPNNIMLEHGGRVVLLDFGLARGHRHSTLTQPQTLLGTLPYIAPELLRGGEAGTPADLWSLGVVAAELRLGRLPWRADSSIEMAVEVGRFHAWSQYPPITDARWNALVESMLRADPGARIGAVELGQRLDVC